MQSLSDRFYRLLLLAYPADFRYEYGPHMAQFFHDRCQAQPSVGGLAQLWAHTLLDWAFTVPAEHADVLHQDLRYGWRVLARAPAFTAAAGLSLALGIAGVTAIFSAVYAVVLRPLPYRDPDRLVQITEVVTTAGSLLSRDTTPWFAVSPANFLDWRAQNHVFEDMAAIYNFGAVIVGADRADRVRGQMVNASFFPLLGVEPLLGRTFHPEEDRPGGEPVVVLSYGLWQRRFGADATILGRPILMDAAPYTVIGVMPPAFRFFTDKWTRELVELWVAYPFRRDPPTERESHRMRAFARLRPGVSLAQAQAEMDTIHGGIRQQYPELKWTLGVRLMPLRDYWVIDDRNSLWTLLAASGLVLLIACANVANLLLARAAAREREIAIRVSIGAGWRRLTRQLLTESLLLALLGGLAGVALAWWAAAALPALSPGAMVRLDETRVDLRVLGFALLACLGSGLLFGLAPARRLVLHDPARRRNRNRLGAALMVSQIALSVVLLTAAGLAIHSLWRLAQANLGFDPTSVLTFRVYLPKEKAADVTGQDRGRNVWTIRPQAIALFDDIERRLTTIPGVEAVGSTSGVPFNNNGWGFEFQVEGRPSLPPGENYHLGVTPGYFHALRTRLQQGRLFTAQDNERAPRVVILNEVMARRLFPNENPLGRRLRFQDSYISPEVSAEVVGVVSGARHSQVRNDNDDVLYTPLHQRPSVWADSQIGFRQSMNYVARGSNPHGLAASVRPLVRELDPQALVENVATMEELVVKSSKPVRSAVWLLGLFAAVALVLSAIGIYGVVSYAVERRAREIGIRMALGAQAGDVIRMVLRQGLVLTVLGLALGLAGARAATRVLASLLYGVKPTDSTTFAAVAAFFTLVALAACYIPARRAARLDPMTTLRCE